MSCGGVKRYLDVAFETCQTISAGLTIGTTYRLTILAVPIHADKRIDAPAARGVEVLRRVVPSQDTERGRTESLAVASAAVRGRDCGALIYSGICGAASESQGRADGLETARLPRTYRAPFCPAPTNNRRHEAGIYSPPTEEREDRFKLAEKNEQNGKKRN